MILVPNWETKSQFSSTISSHIIGLQLQAIWNNEFPIHRTIEVTDWLSIQWLSQDWYKLIHESLGSINYKNYLNCSKNL